MISYGVISLLALATASTASPIINAARRGSSLIPTPPPACLAKASSTALSASNTTSGANATNLTDTSSLSNVNNTTTTCVVSTSDLQALISGLNGADVFNATSINNCTDLTNSTPSDTISSSDSSTTTSSTNTATATSSAGSSADNGSGDTTDTSSTDTSSTDTNTTDTATTATTAASTGNSTYDSAAPPASTAPPSGSSSGDDGTSSGIFDPSTGEFTADTSDPSGRRKRSLLRVVLHSILPRFNRKTPSHHRRLAQADLPAIAQKWQDLCLASGGDIFTSDPCVNLAGVAGINALLSTGGVCDQQDNADKMIDFAKSPGVKNQDALIAAAIAYRKHPRNAEDIGGGELVGVINEQLPGVNPGLFGGSNSPVVAFGADGTCPAGQTPFASTCSCV